MKTRQSFALYCPALYALLALTILLLAITPGHTASEGQKPVKTREVSPQTSPVALDGKVLFSVQSIKTTSAEKRAGALSERIKKLAQDYTVQTDSIRPVDTDFSTDIFAGDQIIMVIIDNDARPEGRTRQDLGKEYAEIIRKAVDRYRIDYGRTSLLYGGLYSGIATIAFIVSLILLLRLFRRLHNLIETKYRERIHSIHIKSMELVQAERVRTAVSGALNVVRLIAVVVLSYTYVHFVLSSFPWTRSFADQILYYILVPLKIIGRGMVKEVPNLFFIAVLVVVARYILKLMHLVFMQIEKGTITLAGFYPEWARPTERLLTFTVIAFTAVVAFPYIPGSESPAFKGISIFIGVLFSLGSQSAVSNIIGGFVMTYRRAFKVGDRIRIGEIIGDVAEIRLQLTHIRTIKNEDIIVPNSMILNSSITNYSSLARERGLILHTTAGIGYEVSWRQVEAMLKMAAERTPGPLKDPRPFVLQKSLGDFAVTYELNVYIDDPHDMAQIYSELHRNILDVFNEYGVQIMTPAYEGDPDKPKVVPKDRWYSPPAKPENDREEGKKG